MPTVQIKSLSYALLLLILPNLIFWIAALIMSMARPIINLDYFIRAMLFIFTAKPVNLLGLLFFWWAVLFDTLMMVMQQFPFMDLIGAYYLIPFVAEAPLLYQLLGGILVLYLFIMPFLLQKISKKTDFLHVLIIVIPFGKEVVLILRG